MLPAAALRRGARRGAARRRCLAHAVNVHRPPLRWCRRSHVVGQIYAGRMPLKLVTGPANSAKAGEVLGGYRDRLDEEPILVVPEFRDVEHAQREMAANGAVFGVRVARFGWLWELMARRVGYSARVASRFQRELLVARGGQGRATCACSRRRRSRPGFSRAAARFLAEVGRAGIEPDELGSALSDWARRRARAALRARDRADPRRLPRGARRGRAGRSRAVRLAHARRVPRRTPRAWGATPVFVYGFDDFTDVELAGIEALAEHVDVTLSFPYERGRHAFDALADTFARLEAVGGRARRAGGRARPLRRRARATRSITSSGGLFDASGRRASPAGTAVRLHSAGGERAEVELAAASVLEQLAAGTPAGDIAVVFRSPERYASLVDQVFFAYGIPFSLDRRVPLGHTRARPRPACAAALRACPSSRRHDGRPAHIPALARPPRRARPCRHARGQGAPGRRPRRRRGARSSGRTDNEKLAADRDRRAARCRAATRRHCSRSSSGGWSGCSRARTCAGRTSSAATRRTSPRDVRGRPRRTRPDARARERGAHGRVSCTTRWATLPVMLGDPPQPDRVQVTGPLEVRARRFEVLYLLGLQEGEFPRPARARPVPLRRRPARDRRARPGSACRCARTSSTASDTCSTSARRAPSACSSCRRARATRRAARSSRRSSSRTCAQVLDLPERPDAARGLSDVVWELDEAPTRARSGSARPRRPGRACPPSVPDGLASDELVRGSSRSSRCRPGAIEAFADCPVKWLVERRCGRTLLEPERGAARARRLRAPCAPARVLGAQRLRGQPRRITRENLAEAERILHRRPARVPGASSRSRRTGRASARPCRKLEFDLLRYLRDEADSTSRFEPDELELSFGGDGEEPVSIGIDGLQLHRPDRPRRHARRPRARARLQDRPLAPRLRCDASGRRTTASRSRSTCSRCSEVRAGARGRGGRVRPARRRATRSRAGSCSRTPATTSATAGPAPTGATARSFEAILDEAREAVREVLERMRRGDVRPCPESCAWNGGCSYPAICRHEA